MSGGLLFGEYICYRHQLRPTNFLFTTSICLQLYEQTDYGKDFNEGQQGFAASSAGESSLIHKFLSYSFLELCHTVSLILNVS